MVVTSWIRPTVAAPKQLTMVSDQTSASVIDRRIRRDCRRQGSPAGPTTRDRDRDIADPLDTQ